MSRLSGRMQASATWDPGSIGTGANEALDVTVTDAEMGDFAFATHDVDVSDLVSDAQVTAADTVTVVLSNASGGSVDLASHNVEVRVYPKEVF